jgi:hypothetical protein
METSVPQYLRDHARHLNKHPMTIASTTMRYQSPAGLELLAAMATGGTMGYAEALARLRELVAAGSSTAGNEFDVVAVAALARAKAGWPGEALDYTESADLHQATRLILSDGRSRAGLGLPGYTDRLDAQTNLAAGRVDYVSSIVPTFRIDEVSRWMLETELAHPELGRAGSTIEDWLRSFNRLFEDRGLLPITLRDGDGSRFDCIEPARTPVPVDAPGPTVSIIMSVFKPDASLVTSLRSLMSQTWPHLQVLVVDDCSPDEYQPLIAEAVALDDRIELLRMPVNGGTYKIRNFAMARARGEFVGFQDSDDWSHPERIEHQLRPLLDDPSLMASLSRAVRLDSRLSQNKVGFSSLRQNASSLLFRRDPVLSALGGYDEVRKAADSEFTSRLEAVFGSHSIRDLDLPLALVQLTSDSLSRGDFMFGWRNANRVFYRESYMHWHTRMRTGTEARLVPGRPRTFPAPPPYVSGTPDDSERRFDVVLMSDWRQGVSRYEGGAAEVAALAVEGLTVAAAHARRERLPPGPETMDLRASGALTPVRWEDPLRAPLVVVRDPELLSYPRHPESSRLRAERVVIVAGHPPTSPTGNLVYDPDVVEQNARELFGAEPEWLPASEVIAGSLASVSGRAVHPPMLLGAVSDAAVRRTGLRGGDRPIMGATADALPHDPPTWEEWLDIFPDDDGYDVRIRDSERALASVAARRTMPPNWLRTTEPSDAAFVGQLDFLVGLPLRSAGLEPVQAALSALAHGCVVLLDPGYEPVFGPAALYLRGKTARQLVEEMVSRPDHHRQQQERGYAFIDAELSPEVFAARIGALLAGAERKESA